MWLITCIMDVMQKDRYSVKVQRVKSSVWNDNRFDFFLRFLVFPMQTKEINVNTKHLQWKYFSLSDRSAGVPIFLTMTVYLREINPFTVLIKVRIHILSRGALSTFTVSCVNAGIFSRRQCLWRAFISFSASSPMRVNGELTVKLSSKKGSCSCFMWCLWTRSGVQCKAVPTVDESRWAVFPLFKRELLFGSLAWAWLALLGMKLFSAPSRCSFVTHEHLALLTQYCALPL